MNKFHRSMQFLRDIGDKEKNTSAGEWLLVLIVIIGAATGIVWAFPASPMYVGGETVAQDIPVPGNATAAPPLPTMTITPLTPTATLAPQGQVSQAGIPQTLAECRAMIDADMTEGQVAICNYLNSRELENIKSVIENEPNRQAHLAAWREAVAENNPPQDTRAAIEGMRMGQQLGHIQQPVLANPPKEVRVYGGFVVPDECRPFTHAERVAMNPPVWDKNHDPFVHAGTDSPQIPQIAWDTDAWIDAAGKYVGYDPMTMSEMYDSMHVGRYGFKCEGGRHG